MNDPKVIQGPQIEGVINIQKSGFFDQYQSIQLSDGHELCPIMECQSNLVTLVHTGWYMIQPKKNQSPDLPQADGESKVLVSSKKRKLSDNVNTPRKKSSSSSPPSLNSSPVSKLGNENEQQKIAMSFAKNLSVALDKVKVEFTEPDPSQTLALVQAPGVNLNTLASLGSPNDLLAVQVPSNSSVDVNGNVNDFQDLMKFEVANGEYLVAPQLPSSASAQVNEGNEKLYFRNPRNGKATPLWWARPSIPTDTSELLSSRTHLRFLIYLVTKKAKEGGLETFASSHVKIAMQRMGYNVKDRSCFNPIRGMMARAFNHKLTWDLSDFRPMRKNKELNAKFEQAAESISSDIL